MNERTDDLDDRYQRITLRLPRELHRRLMDEADRQGWSMNAEIIGRLTSETAGDVRLQEVRMWAFGMADRWQSLSDVQTAMEEKMRRADELVRWVMKPSVAKGEAS